MSKRIYITLNEDKEKDKKILDYLSQSYRAQDTIKEILYRLAINGCLSVQNDNISQIKSSTVEVQQDDNRCDMDTKKKKIIEPVNTNKVHKDDKRRKNELNQLKGFI
ncbi:hypothetical protein BJV85_002837 [Clostridium acetobutylicum]|uniref:Uncharacterized protein n=1 Tax=Clostridium acetobutylicum (strain ATCC 824 / DSM 792 / JCM 1419 / IAM 19013 / LMG 5710 / NBRC 13948 / NRRL B-527 / VKM B-1787 / 2291 / W) TaxID=272562 RepID=Q97JW1_CLOAB|nr:MULTISPECIES: hypothetical protein [Clostridium]AAK79134.1 Hypothetical protein, CF-11 family [Clostridium acetobutylicum ATCC 824]ADZ20212.1 conserved hypothetical protein [Clostridium acetobutylicum EA 2018]AEI31670.1 hypothetical protein SMB_G1182 [Clostridium acetobutylicum DSM 1731]AWV81613.1 hypothetical protein DK921_16245 [Clostridium acetobutylicum]MBC2393256.1 hypothetical protein [Clostridium acetobutylicum]